MIVPHLSETTLVGVTAIAPATISPRRAVPAHIPRPEYVDKPGPEPFTGSEVKDSDTIERMTGHPPAELVGGHFSRIVHESSLPLTLERWDALVAEQEERQRQRAGGPHAKGLEKRPPVGGGWRAVHHHRDCRFHRRLRLSRFAIRDQG